MIHHLMKCPSSTRFLKTSIFHSQDQNAQKLCLASIRVGKERFDELEVDADNCSTHADARKGLL
jgi:hypothetical protein